MKKIAVIIGPSQPDENERKRAYEAGKFFAEKGYIIATGGLYGVMEEAMKGAKESKGLTLGIIPSDKKDEANKYCDIVIPTGMGRMRNVLLILSADIVIACGLSEGTFTEIAYAIAFKKKIFTYGFKIDKPYKIPYTTNLKELESYI